MAGVSTDTVGLRVKPGSFVVKRGSSILNEKLLDKILGKKPKGYAGGGTVPIKATPKERIAPPEVVDMYGIDFFRAINNSSDNAAHSSMDALIAQSELAGMRPMYGGGEVAPGYENGGSIPPNVAKYISQMQVMPDMDIRRSEPLSDLNLGLERLMEEQEAIPDVYEQIKSYPGKRIFQKKKGYPDADETISALKGDKAGLEYLLKQISGQNPKKQYADRPSSRGGGERTGYQIMSRGQAPEIDKETGRQLENYIYDPETGEIKKSRNIPIERMISIDPEDVKMWGYNKGGAVGYQEGEEVAPADATANAIMSQLLLKEVAQQSPEYYYSEEREGYDPAKEIAEGAFMPIGGVISGAKGLMRLPTHTTGTPLAKGIKKSFQEADELLKRTRKTARRGAGANRGLKKKLINEIDEAGLPDAYGEPMSYFKDLHTDDLADILKEYYGKELYQANRGLHGLLKASGYQEGDVVGYQQGEQVVDPNDPLGINKRQAMGAQAYAGSTIAGAGGGVSVGDVAEAVEIDEMQKVNQAMEALKLQGIYNEPERSGYFEFQGDVPQSEADQMRMVFSLLRDMENQKALNQLLMQSGRMGGQLNPIHQGLFFKP